MLTSQKPEPSQGGPTPVLFHGPSFMTEDTMKVGASSNFQEAVDACQKAFMEAPGGDTRKDVPKAFFEMYVLKTELPTDGKWVELQSYPEATNSLVARFDPESSTIDIYSADAPDKFVFAKNGEPLLQHWEPDIQVFSLNSTNPETPPKYISPYDEIAPLGKTHTLFSSNVPALYVARRGKNSVGVFPHERHAQLAEMRYAEERRLDFGLEDPSLGPDDKVRKIPLPENKWVEVKGYQFNEDAPRAKTCFARFDPEAGIEIVTAGIGEKIEIDLETNEPLVGPATPEPEQSPVEMGID